MANFYEQIEGFSAFNGLSNDHNYRPTPADWWVVVTDVRGSTKAIEAGRYKDVNTIGVASIIAIQNAMGKESFPFVFGGDGATALIPGSGKKPVEKELNALRHISKTKFGLELRVGMVSVAELLADGFPVKVAKLLLPSGTPIALFRGGALTRAEEKIKGEEEKYEVRRSESLDTNLRSLSCRWNPIPSSKGRVVSLLVLANAVDTETSDKTYSDFLEELTGIMKEDDGNPVNVDMMKYRSVGEMLRSDFRHQTRWWRLIPRMIDTVLASWVFGVRLSRWIKPAQNYVNVLADHSDYRKFDDLLRMVLDCTEEQIRRIDEMCQSFQAEGRICYGIHLSDTALMTCQFASFEAGTHLHFIDGGDGGYAIAAKQLKYQLKKVRG